MRGLAPMRGDRYHPGGHRALSRTHRRLCENLLMPSTDTHAFWKPQLALYTAFKRFFWMTYDHIGLMILANLMWLVLSLGIITAPAATAGLASLTAGIAAGKDVSMRDLFRGFREHFIPALKIGVFDLVVAVALWVNVDFYSHLGGRAAIPGFLFAALLIWGAGFWLLLHIHIYPLMVAGERSFRHLIRTSALLTLDNLSFTIGLALQSLMLIMLCILTGIGIIALLSAMLCLLHATARRQLLRKYRDDMPDEVPETRTWRHLWRPWETSSRG